MDKEEIIRRLKKISEHAVHVAGKSPFIISLDDGIALREAVSLLKEQDTKPVKPKLQMKRHLSKYMSMQCCGNCTHVLSEKWFYCPGCGRKIDWH